MDNAIFGYMDPMDYEIAVMEAEYDFMEAKQEAEKAVRDIIHNVRLKEIEYKAIKEGYSMETLTEMYEKEMSMYTEEAKEGGGIFSAIIKWLQGIINAIFNIKDDGQKAKDEIKKSGAKSAILNIAEGTPDALDKTATVFERIANAFRNQKTQKIDIGKIVLGTGITITAVKGAYEIAGGILDKIKGKNNQADEAVPIEKVLDTIEKTITSLENVRNKLQEAEKEAENVKDEDITDEDNRTAIGKLKTLLAKLGAAIKTVAGWVRHPIKSFKGRKGNAEGNTEETPADNAGGTEGEPETNKEEENKEENKGPEVVGGSKDGKPAGNGGQTKNPSKEVVQGPDENAPKDNKEEKQEPEKGKEEEKESEVRVAGAHEAYRSNIVQKITPLGKDVDLKAVKGKKGKNAVTDLLTIKNEFLEKLKGIEEGKKIPVKSTSIGKHFKTRVEDWKKKYINANGDLTFDATNKYNGEIKTLANKLVEILDDKSVIIGESVADKYLDQYMMHNAILESADFFADVTMDDMDLLLEWSTDDDIEELVKLVNQL